MVYSAFRSAGKTLSLHRFEGRHEVGHEVVGVLKPGGETNEPVGDAELGALFGREPLMGRRRRLGDEALSIAKIVGWKINLSRRV